jgi:pilus assembly protein CpaD
MNPITHLAGARPRAGGPSRARPGRLAAIALAAALAGCQTGNYSEIQETGSIRAFRTSDRHPILVEKGAARLSIDLPGYIRELSPRQREDIDAFLTEYKTLGEGELVVAVPSGTANEGAAIGTVGTVRAMIERAGIRKTLVRYVPYRGAEGPARSGAEPPMVLSFERFFAQASPCGNWPSNVAHEPYNKPYAEFGCGYQNNLAAMVADPRDLIRPRKMGSSDVERRKTVLDLYRKGKVTSADRSADEMGSVAEVDDQ